MVKHLELDCIVYGNGNKFHIEKFVPVKNFRFVKPKGGLWASPVNSRYGWKEWCADNDFGYFDTKFEFTYSGNTLVVESESDLIGLPVDPDMRLLGFLNFEELARSGIDAIFLTEEGEHATRFSEPGLYGWDCESILVMNPHCVKEYSYR